MNNFKTFVKNQKIGFEVIDKAIKKACEKEISLREREIMKEQHISLKDILTPGPEKCLECKQEVVVPGMWVCEKCYDKRSKQN